MKCCSSIQAWNVHLVGAFLAVCIGPSMSKLWSADQQLPVRPMSSEERKLARDFSRGKSAASQQAIDALKKAISNEVSRLTQPAEAEKAGDIRVALQLGYLSTYRPGMETARQTIVETIATWAGGIATRDTFSPVARINCMALLAELDDLPALGQASPKPSVKAFETLYRVANNDQAPIYLRAIALHGMERHIGAYWGVQNWRQRYGNATGQVLVSIVNSKPANELEERAHTWLVRRAYDCLGTTGVAAVADQALQNLVDAKALPSLRLSSAAYLSKLDAKALKPEQKTKYVIGIAHLLRSQMVSWYEHEDDIIKRDSGASGMGGGYGGGYGGDGGYGMGMGMGGGYGGEEGGYGMGMGGGYGEGGYGGGYGGETGRRKKVKATDVQTWQTIVARRKANQITQLVHTCLDGLPALEGRQTKLVGTPLLQAELEAETATKLTELVALLDTLQTELNDVENAPDTNTLLNKAELPIEDIMDLVLEIPGFKEQYPDLAEDEDLEHVPEAPKDPPAAGGEGAAAGENAQGGNGNAGGNTGDAATENRNGGGN